MRHHLIYLTILVFAFSAVALGQDPPRSTRFEDKPEVIQPKAVSEADEDRREAQALFAAARRKQDRGELPGALRLYQRAHRRDPGRAAILFEIVKLAEELKRPALFDSYGMAAAEADPKNGTLLSVLAQHFTRQGSFENAVQLYEKVLALETKAKKDARYVALLMDTGRLHFVTGNHRSAAERFTQVLAALDRAKDFGLTDTLRQQLLGNASRTYQMIGESFLQAGRLKDAEEAFETAYRINRDKPGEAYQMARVHAAAARFDEAKKQLQVYFDAGADSHGSGPYQTLAEIYEKQKKSAELAGDLQKRFDELSDKGQDDVYLAFFLAEEYRKSKQYPKAEPLYERVIKAAEGKENLVPAMAAAQLSMAKMYRETKDASKLLRVFGWVAGMTGDFRALGEEAQALDKDKALTAAMVKAAQAEKDKLDYGGNVAAALLASEQKEPKLASEFFEAAVADKPDVAAQTVLTWGIALLQAERPTEAVKVFERGIDEELLPAERPEYHYWLAMALESDGKTEEALKAALRAVSKAKSDPRMHARVAWVHYHAKRYAEAKKGYQALIKRFEGDDPKLQEESVRSQVRQARLILSNIAVIENDMPTAEELLEQVLDEDPNDTQGNNDLGYLWADQNKRLQSSLQMVRKSLAVEPKNAAYLDSLGWVYYRLGKYEAAVAELKKAVDADETPDGTILDHLGDAYAKMEQTDKAREAWERAVKSFDKERDAEKIKATQIKIDQLK